MIRNSRLAMMLALSGAASLAVAASEIVTDPNRRPRAADEAEEQERRRERERAERDARLAARPEPAPRELTAGDHERIRRAAAKRARKAAALNGGKGNG